MQVQPKRIQFMPKSTGALCWLVGHWSQAKLLDLDLSFLPVGVPHHTYWEVPEVASWEARDVKDRVADLSVLQVTAPHYIVSLSCMTSSCMTSCFSVLKRQPSSSHTRECLSKTTEATITSLWDCPSAAHSRQQVVPSLP